MAQEPTLNPPAADASRITRDRLAILPGVCGFLALLLANSEACHWLEGRLHNPQLHVRLELCLYVIWLLLTGWLTFRSLQRFSSGTAAQQIRWTLLLALVWAPWGLPFLDWSPRGYLRGFASWASKNIDAQAFRQWALSVPVDTTQCTRKSRLLVVLPEGVDVCPVDKPLWPDLPSPAPKEIYILPDRSCMFLLWPGSNGYGSMVLVPVSGWPPSMSRYRGRGDEPHGEAMPGVPPPMSVWPDVAHLRTDGLWVFISYPH